MFTDRVRLRLVAGKGGNGVIAWRREKYIPKGGPSGGNGGRGGSIILRVDPRLRSLDHYRYRRLLRAENGRSGGSERCQGRRGQDLVIPLPPGTLVKNGETGEVLRDLAEAELEWRICEGGRGGRGNASFATPTHRAPAVCTPGKDGEELFIEFELKLIADVGLVGFPNAGKSSLIRALTRSKAKVAPYPFTTLSPNLGLLKLTDANELVIADIPGIIERASENRGLGLDFLRHIERTRYLLFVLDAAGFDGRDPISDFRVLQKELRAYDEELLERPFLIILNKCDLEEMSTANIEAFLKEGLAPADKIVQISALEGTGLDQLLSKLASLVVAQPDRQDLPEGQL